MLEPKPYTYFIYSKITNEFYIGSRRANVNANRSSEEDFWRYYFTSSKTVAQMIKRDGSDSFVYEIIYENADAEENFWYEQKLIRENFNNPLCLNKHCIDRERSHLYNKKHGKIESEWISKWEVDAYIYDRDDIRPRAEIIGEAIGVKPKMVTQLLRLQIAASMPPKDREVFLQNTRYKKISKNQYLC